MTGEGKQTEMRKERRREGEEKMWRYIMRRGEEKEREARRKKEEGRGIKKMLRRKDRKREQEGNCRGGKTERERQIEGKENAGDVFFFPLPFISPQCHPDYISATC